MASTSASPAATRHAGGVWPTAVPDRVSAAVAEAVGSGDYRKTYGDYCLLYSSLASKDAAAKALDIAPSLADHIDDGSSMSYLLAYLMTR